MVSRNRNLDKRPNWFDRQFVRAQDFADGDDYALDRRRRHTRLLHTPGVAEGLRVTGAAGDSAVPGLTVTALSPAAPVTRSPSATPGVCSSRVCRRRRSSA